MSRSTLETAGLLLEPRSPRRPIITGSGRISAPTFILPELRVGEISLSNFPVFGMDFPEGSGIEGILGLDFLRGKRVTIDFRQGLLDIE